MTALSRFHIFKYLSFLLLQLSAFEKLRHVVLLGWMMETAFYSQMVFLNNGTWSTMTRRWKVLCFFLLLLALLFGVKYRTDLDLLSIFVYDACHIPVSDTSTTGFAAFAPVSNLPSGKQKKYPKGWFLFEMDLHVQEKRWKEGSFSETVRSPLAFAFLWALLVMKKKNELHGLLVAEFHDCYYNCLDSLLRTSMYVVLLIDVLRGLVRCSKPYKIRFIVAWWQVRLLWPFQSLFWIVAKTKRDLEILLVRSKTNEWAEYQSLFFYWGGNWVQHWNLNLCPIFEGRCPDLWSDWIWKRNQRVKGRFIRSLLLVQKLVGKGALSFEFVRNIKPRTRLNRGQPSNVWNRYILVVDLCSAILEVSFNVWNLFQLEMKRMCSDSKRRKRDHFLDLTTKTPDINWIRSFFPFFGPFPMDEKHSEMKSQFPFQRALFFFFLLQGSQVSSKKRVSGFWYWLCIMERKIQSGPFQRSLRVVFIVTWPLTVPNCSTFAHSSNFQAHD